VKLLVSSLTSSSLSINSGLSINTPGRLSILWAGINTPGRDQYSGQRSILGQRTILQAEINTPDRDQYSGQGINIPGKSLNTQVRVPTQGESINSGTGHDEVRWLSGSPGTKMMHHDDDEEGEV